MSMSTIKNDEAIKTMSNSNDSLCSSIKYLADITLKEIDKSLVYSTNSNKNHNIIDNNYTY